MPKYEFSEIEIQALIKLIDSGVKHDGLGAAMNAALLVQKLQQPLDKPLPKPVGDKDKK